jgi:hypothetical protein
MSKVRYLIHGSDMKRHVQGEMPGGQGSDVSHIGLLILAFELSFPGLVRSSARACQQSNCL